MPQQKTFLKRKQPVYLLKDKKGFLYYNVVSLLNELHVTSSAYESSAKLYYKHELADSIAFIREKKHVDVTPIIVREITHVSDLTP